MKNQESLGLIYGISMKSISHIYGSYEGSQDLLSSAYSSSPPTETLGTRFESHFTTLRRFAHGVPTPKPPLSHCHFTDNFADRLHIKPRHKFFKT